MKEFRRVDISTSKHWNIHLQVENKTTLLEKSYGVLTVDRIKHLL